MRLLLVIFLIIGGISAHAATPVVFQGLVSDSITKRPIPFAKVYIPSLDLGTIADMEGKFQLESDLPEQITVRISASDYISKTIEVFPSKFLSIQLLGSHLDLEEITISAPGSELDNLNIFNIEKIELSNGAANNTSVLTDAIATINGVQTASIGPGIGKPVVRGLQGLRVLTLINGVRMDNQQWGSDHGIAVGKLGIGSVEVIKGPSSLLYGGDAFGGVIYLKDERFTTQNAQEITIGSRFETVNLGTQSDLLYKLSKNNLRFTAGFLHGNFADFKLPNGKYLKNSRFKQLGGKANLAYNKGNWTTNVRYTYSRTRAGIPGHTHDSIFTAETFQSENQNRKNVIPTQIAENHIASWQNKWFLKKGEFNILVSHTQNLLQEFEEKVTIAALNSKLNNTLLNLSFKYKFGNQFTLYTGTQSYYQTHINGKKWAEELIPNYNQIDNGLYTLGVLSLSKIKMQLGARLDYRVLNVSNENFNGSYLSPNFSVGISNKDINNQLRINISSGYRAPHVSELFADGAHHGALRIEKGNANLVPEQSYQVDVSFEKKGEHFSAIVNPHYSYLTNYITLEQQDTLIGTLPVFNYIQFSEAQLYGVDLSIHYHPHFIHALHIQSGFSYVRAASFDGRNLNLIPQAKLDNYLQYKFESKSDFKIEDINLQYQYFLEQNQIGLLETKSPDYHLLNLGVNLKYKEIFKISCGVRNVFNTSYTNHLSRLKNINSSQEGRNFYINLRYQFKNKLK